MGCSCFHFLIITSYTDLLIITLKFAHHNLPSLLASVRTSFHVIKPCSKFLFSFTLRIDCCNTFTYSSSVSVLFSELSVFTKSKNAFNFLEIFWTSSPFVLKKYFYFHHPNSTTVLQHICFRKYNNTSLLRKGQNYK